MPFCADFGPLNLGKTDKACEMLKELLTSPKYHRTKLVYYTSLDANETTNAIFLLGSFLVLHLSATSEDAWAPFCTLQGAGVCVCVCVCVCIMRASQIRSYTGVCVCAVIPYRDATWVPSDYDLSRTAGQALETLSSCVCMTPQPSTTMSTCIVSRL